MRLATPYRWLVAVALVGAPEASAWAAPASTSDDVPRGVVLGFDLDQGKPRIVVNLDQAQLQGVKLESSLLKLAQIVA